MTTDTQPLAPTDAELIAELEAAGVEFMAFRGGLCGTKEVWVTAGSQDAKKIAQGVRAVLAKWGVQPVAPSEPTPAFDDPRVQAVYEILCDDTDWPPKEVPQKHWEGWIARRIVERLFQEPVVREPLTDEQIREWWASENGLEDCDMCKLEDFLLVVRAVEEKHGIKGGQHGAE